MAQAQIPVGFEAAAAGYDQVAESALGLALRKRVHQVLAELVGSGDRVLDLGCGTGIDAAWLAERAGQVVGVDPTVAMIVQARRRALSRGAKVRLEVGDIHSVSGPFDLVLSNFGAINCMGRLAPIGDRLGEIVVAGGHAVLVTMPVVAPVERALALVRRDLAGWRRRKSGRDPDHPGLVIEYATARDLAGAMPGFELLRAESVGLVLPGFEQRAWFENRPGLLGAVDRLDRWVAPLGGRLGWGDHLITVWRRHPRPQLEAKTRVADRAVGIGGARVPKRAPRGRRSPLAMYRRRLGAPTGASRRPIPSPYISRSVADRGAASRHEPATGARHHTAGLTPSTVPAETASRFQLTVPGTDQVLVRQGDELVAGAARFGRLDHGIWDLTRPADRERLDRFAADYAATRAAEGRVLSGAAVRRLPDIDPGDPLADMWSQRRASWLRLVDHLPAPGPDSTALDLGAGCGWMAARLADLGWKPAAIDITVDGGDGLAAARHHHADMLMARADMAALPFASDSIDLAIFNASLHYAADISVALGEARRVLRPGGLLAVVDSPVFTEPAAGQAMVVEFAETTRDRHGIEPAIHRGPGFVTWDQLIPFGLHDPTATTAATALRTRFHRWRGARRAGREVAQRPLLIARTPIGARQ